MRWYSWMSDFSRCSFASLSSITSLLEHGFPSTHQYSLPNQSILGVVGLFRSRISRGFAPSFSSLVSLAPPRPRLSAQLSAAPSDAPPLPSSRGAPRPSTACPGSRPAEAAQLQGCHSHPYNYEHCPQKHIKHCAAFALDI